MFFYYDGHDVKLFNLDSKIKLFKGKYQKI